jgi:transcriptional regulator with PAS, ATPase and Fis domain
MSGGAAIEERVLESENARIVTRAPSLFSIFDQIPVAAKHDFTILLVGETGTGKTYLARIIHELSTRRDEPYVHVACGALQNELMDSELFGHIKGSFTGADNSKEGKFAVAKKGTLLLDEIDVLRPAQQAKLLRVLESGEYERVGCNETRRMNARLIVTTNIDLESLIEKEQFRSDLYFRLKQVKFEIPPLRSRPVDIFPLALLFIEQFCHNHGMVIHRIHPDFPAALEAYSWPGNIRELRNEISRAVLFCKDGVLDPTTLSPKIQHAERSAGNAHIQPRLASEIAQTEQATIESMLRAHSFNRAATARALGISRVTLYNKIRKYRIQVSAG